jgi:hypothetical protein
MNSGVKICLDKQVFGECTKGKDCQACHLSIFNKIDNTPLNINDLNLNKNAKGYIPKSKRLDNSKVNQDNSKELENKLILNLHAKEYVPKYFNENPKVREELNVEDDEDELPDDDEGVEFDIIMKDILNNEIMEELEEEEECDEDKWFPKYNDCECCKGFIYKCKGVACENMESCYCKIKDECDQEEDLKNLN